MTRSTSVGDVLIRAAAIAAGMLLTGCSPTSDPPAPSASETPSPSARPSILAGSAADMGAACTGQAIANAGPYDPAGPATVGVFLNSPDQAEYVEFPVGYGHDFYADPAGDFTKINVVACLTTVPDSTGTPTECSGVHRLPYQLDVTFVATATGETIGTGRRIDALADGCPLVLVYNQQTRNAYGLPDADSIIAEVESFLSSR